MFALVHVKQDSDLFAGPSADTWNRAPHIDQARQKLKLSAYFDVLASDDLPTAPAALGTSYAPYVLVDSSGAAIVIYEN